jgi:hypothetical protein
VSRDCDLDLDLEDYRCHQCNAEVTLTPDRVHDGIYWLRVRHAAGCPLMANVRAARWN